MQNLQFSKSIFALQMENKIIYRRVPGSHQKYLLVFFYIKNTCDKKKYEMIGST